MRKIVIFGLLVVMLAGLAVPAFAIGESGTDDTVYYPVVSFDTIDCIGSSYGYTFPYPFSSGMLSSIGEFNYGDVDAPYLLGTQKTVDTGGTYPQIQGTIKGPLFNSNKKFVLKGGYQVIDLDDVVNGFYITYDTSVLTLGWCEIGIRYYVFSDTNIPGRYTVQSKSFAVGANMGSSNGVFNIGEKLFSKLEPYAVGGRLFVEQIYIMCQFAPKSVSTVSFNFFVDTNNATYPGDPSDLGTWIYDNDLIIQEPTDPDSLTGWLTDSVGSFLAFELFPGFSINKIFAIVLTIGIMLWFITLLI